jgi:hypothetical protein
MILVPLLLTGCGVKPVPVKGVVVIDGKPSPHAFVMFTPQETGGKEAHGATDEHGVFHLTTFRAKDGALPGHYKVTVAYTEPAPVEKGLSPAEVQQAQTEPRRVLPPMYAQIDETVLEHRVPEDGDVKLELHTVAP